VGYFAGGFRGECFRSAPPALYPFIVCFENPVLRTGSQKETLVLSCFLLDRTQPGCVTAFGHHTKPPVSRVVVCSAFTLHPVF